MAETVTFMDADVTLHDAVLSVENNGIKSFTVPTLPSNYLLVAREGLTTILLPVLDYSVEGTTLTFTNPMNHRTMICAIDLSDGSVAWSFDFVSGQA